MENGITITANNIITIAAVISAVFAIFGTVFAVHRWYLKQNKQDEDIKAIKKRTVHLNEGCSRVPKRA